MFIIQKRKFFLFLFFTLTFLVVFFLGRKTVLALEAGDVADVIFGILSSPAYAVFILIFLVLLMISDFFLWMSGAILNWVMSPGFFTFSYTGMDNPVIAAGLPPVQALAGIILFLVFVFVALAIALDIAGYGTKKTFVKLVLVALLINFAPLLCGLIVDAGNVFTYYFLKECQKGVGDIAGGLSTIGDTVWAGIKGFFKGAAAKARVLARTFFLVILNFALGFGFLLFALIFFFRYFAIWVLVILSPLAFVSSILPRSALQFFHEELWETWLKQLVGWSFIGLTCAFFLWLAVISFDSLKDTLSGLPSPTGEVEDKAFLSSILPYFVIIVFLYLGFTVGLKTGAMGANAIIGFAKGIGAATTVGAVAGGIAGLREGFGKAWKEIKEAPGAWEKVKAGLKGAFWTAPGKGLAEMRRGIRRGAERAAEVLPGEVKEEVVETVPIWMKRPFVTTEREAVAHVEEAYRKKEVRGLLDILKSPVAIALLKEKAFKKLMDEKKLTDTIIEDKDIQDFLRTREGSKYTGEVLKLRPDLAPQFINPRTGLNYTIEEVLNKITPTEALNISPKALLNPFVVEKVSVTQANSIIMKGTPSQKENLMKGFGYLLSREIGTDFDVTTSESLRKELITLQPVIQELINKLSRSTNPTDVAKGKLIEELGNAIYQRKL